MGKNNGKHPTDRIHRALLDIATDELSGAFWNVSFDALYWIADMAEYQETFPPAGDILRMTGIVPPVGLIMTRTGSQGVFLTNSLPPGHAELRNGDTVLAQIDFPIPNT